MSSSQREESKQSSRPSERARPRASSKSSFSKSSHSLISEVSSESSEPKKISSLKNEGAFEEAKKSFQAVITPGLQDRGSGPITIQEAPQKRRVSELSASFKKLSAGFFSARSSKSSFSSQPFFTARSQNGPSEALSSSSRKEMMGV